MYHLGATVRALVQGTTKPPSRERPKSTRPRKMAMMMTRISTTPVVPRVSLRLGQVTFFNSCTASAINCLVLRQYWVTGGSLLLQERFTLGFNLTTCPRVPLAPASLSAFLGLVLIFFMLGPLCFFPGTEAAAPPGAGDITRPGWGCPPGWSIFLKHLG